MVTLLHKFLILLHTKLVILIGTPSQETKAEIGTYPVIAETNIKKALNIF